MYEAVAFTKEEKEAAYMWKKTFKSATIRNSCRVGVLAQGLSYLLGCSHPVFEFLVRVLAPLCLSQLPASVHLGSSSDGAGP